MPYKSSIRISIFGVVIQCFHYSEIPYTNCDKNVVTETIFGVFNAKQSTST
jgi:hypothetical protein